MKNNKTLRKKLLSQFENIYKSSKVSDAKIKYQRFNFQPYYIYDLDESINNLIIYFSNLEEHFNLINKLTDDFNSILKFAKLKKYLDNNNIQKKKEYFKNSSMVRYTYNFEITNKMLFDENKIFYEKVLSNDVIKSNSIIYILDIYLYSSNDYMNDGTNLIDELTSCSPDWFYYMHLKKYTHSYGNYFIKNYKNKNKTLIQKNINESLNFVASIDYIDSIDLESIEIN